MNIYGISDLSKLTTPRRIAGNRDVPDITMIIIMMFRKISVTNKKTPLSLERFLNLKK
jgi:hypothetical protein